METKTIPSQKKVNEVFNSLVKLNELKGNEGLLNDLEMLFLGFVQSDICEEMAGTHREVMTLMFFNLIKVIKSTYGLDEIETSTSMDLKLVDFLNDKGLLEEYLKFRTKHLEAA